MCNFWAQTVPVPIIHNIPEYSKANDSDNDSEPYLLLGDEILQSKKWLMRLFIGKNATERENIHNYCHSRTQRVIKNVFGI